MKIKKFNESDSSPNIQKTPVWIVVIVRPESAYFHDCVDRYEYSPCFTKELLAQDFLIKYINDKCKTNFEPFYDGIDGGRFFLHADDNDEYTDCLSYCFDHNIEVSIVESDLYTNPIR